MKQLIPILISLVALSHPAWGEDGASISSQGKTMIETATTIHHLRDHLTALTVTIGERSVLKPENLQAAAGYIMKTYEESGIAAVRKPYAYNHLTVENIVAEVSFGAGTGPRYVVGAHYDSVAGTVGADDNASAVAVQLELARHLSNRPRDAMPDMTVVFVSFALEEPPVYGTRFMGSRVYARKARRRNERIDGMICLEMVGYTCREPGCQQYPFPLMFFGYPKQGDFIGIVSNGKSRPFSKSLAKAFRTNPRLPLVTLTVPLNGFIMPSVRLSDHASFWSAGYPAVMVTDTAFFRNPNYHHAADTMDNLDFAFMAELVNSLMLFFTAPSDTP